MAAKKSRDIRLADEVEYEGMVLSGKHCDVDGLEHLRELSLDGHILVASFPKTGTTLTQELTWLILNNADTEASRQTPVTDRSLFVEIRNEKGQSNAYELRIGEKQPLKTHLNGKLFRKQLKNDDNLKVILVVRNPKDTFVSLYHFYRMTSYLGNYDGTWSEFYDEIVTPKRTVFGDYFEWYESWFEVMNTSKICLVKYEDLVRDMPQQIRRLAAFLDRSLTDAQIASVARHCSFEEMRVNPSTNYTHMPQNLYNHDISPFMRKGQVGDWKNYMTPEQSQTVDDSYQKLLSRFGVQLDFE